MDILKKIPHLQLPAFYDADMLQAEVDNMPKLIGYELPGEDRTDEERSQYRHNWRGRGLIDFEPDSSKGMLDARSYQGNPAPFDFQRDEDGVKMFPTEIAKDMPICMAIIDELFESPGRCRITQITSEGTLNWHSHSQFKTGNYADQSHDLAIVHVSIKTNPCVQFGVTKFHHSEHGIHPVWQHYGRGEAWLLNSWHEHNVHNLGTDDRIHLMMYGDLDDPKLKELIEPMIRVYNGPFIE